VFESKPGVRDTVAGGYPSCPIIVPSATLILFPQCPFTTLKWCEVKKDENRAKCKFKKKTIFKDIY
jgi:hypothetical protein